MFLLLLVGVMTSLMLMGMAVGLLDRVAALAAAEERAAWRCVQCGYPLEPGGVQSTCPECGLWQFDEPRRAWSAWSLAPLGPGALVAGVMLALSGGTNYDRWAVVAAVLGPFAVMAGAVGMSGLSRWPRRIAGVAGLPCVGLAMFLVSCGGVLGTELLLWSTIAMFMSPVLLAMAAAENLRGGRR
jgi:hypothetical protein